MNLHRASLRDNDLIENVSLKLHLFSLEGRKHASPGASLALSPQFQFVRFFTPKVVYSKAQGQ
ncbi:MAG: hypothetical protein O3B01_32500 [Planctomycetota bacterium]|nr:hypothetical protein [Planctomycetota bacterium]